jgi:hypothetical protein
VEKDVREDESARNELIAMGYQGTPVTLIDGEAIVGFDVERLTKVLNLEQPVC